ncbi:MAG: hypothetical protein ACYC35_16755 [Pirellulales bacterium]
MIFSRATPAVQHQAVASENVLAEVIGVVLDGIPDHDVLGKFALEIRNPTRGVPRAPLGEERSHGVAYAGGPLILGAMFGRGLAFQIGGALFSRVDPI